MYIVTIKKRVVKSLQTLPPIVLQRLKTLLRLLIEHGPMQPKLKNFSKLGKEQYHCHLGYHNVPCWHNRNGTIEIEVYYVGTRQGAPY